MFYKHYFSRLPLLALIGCCFAFGCNSQDDGPQRAAVSGTVTIDGEPVETGAVEFVPTEGTTGPVAGAVIENGKYSAPKKLGPVVGTNRVKINGTRKTGKTVKTQMGSIVDERVPVVPEQYNAQSTLVREVKPGKNVFDFPLSLDGSTP